jgi:hypothetical protein
MPKLIQNRIHTNTDNPQSGLFYMTIQSESFL